jgi:alkanesulfonate monooxygenase
VELLISIGKRENLTIRDLYRRIAGARGHYQVIGTPKDAADMMEEWVDGRACDGFNIMPPVFPSSLREINALLIPELQRRGRFRTRYEGTTLRTNLGLTRPSWSPADLDRPRVERAGTPVRAAG